MPRDGRIAVNVADAGAGPQLDTERLLLRRWTVVDRAPFAALNADAEVMRYFPATLDRAASDALIERIEAGFVTLGYGLWAVQVRSSGEFIGCTGLIRQTFEAPFTPAVEVGWRLARPAWGNGYATESAGAALGHGFAAGLDQIVSMTTRTNERSRAVMRRIGMTHDPVDDFEHPSLPIGHPLRPHVLYRITRARWSAGAGLNR